MTWLPYIFVGTMLAVAAWLLWAGRRRRMANSSSLIPPTRIRFYLGVSLLVHAVLIGYPLVTFTGCRHERPLGVPGGSGNSIAKGTPEGIVGGTGTGAKEPQIVQAKMVMQKVNAREQKHRRETELERLLRQNGLVQLLRLQTGGPIIPMPGAASDDQLESSIVNGSGGDGNPPPLGLPNGTGNGNTAAGSPFGTRIGGTLWLYRIKYDSESWDANWKGLPVLLQEVHGAIGVKVSDSQEIIRLSDLPRHSGEYMPTLLFITGTSRIDTSEQDRANLRSYLLGGGMLLADNSGGDFEAGFEQFIGQTLPDYHLREIERDNEVFRGAQMPYKMTDGCPVYRDHGAKHYARGIFDKDGRLMVFFSPGDMGSAWEIVELGKKRDTVEQAFHMGTNLVTYSLLTVHDTRKTNGK